MPCDEVRCGATFRAARVLSPIINTNHEQSRRPTRGARMSTDWRQKYLDALDTQEELEQQLSAHAEMLRRTIVHLGAASDGLNQRLDHEISLFKEKVRGAKGQTAYEQLGKVEAAVREWHNERAAHTERTAQLLKDYASDFETLRLDKKTEQTIKELRRQITPTDTALYTQFHWLQALRALQQQALIVASKPDRTFWQRLAPGRRLQTAGSTTASKNSPPENSSSDTRLLAKSTALDIDDPESVESILHEIFSALVPRANAVTQDLEDPLSLSLASARAELDNGVTGENIPTFLRVIRDILQQHYMNYGAEFSRYLVQVNAELTRICDAMGHHIEDAARQLGLRSRQDQELAKSQQQLATHNNSETLDALKFAVTEHLAAIGKHLAEREQQKTREKEQQKALQKVNEQLQQVELEAKSTKTLVEKEQHQANRDALTTLPNRASCTQRLEHELERYQRYGHPISVAMCNIDGLKQFNRYSYIIGDRVIKLVAATLRERLRNVDFVGRFQSDNFLLIFPETEPKEAKIFIEKISRYIANTSLNIKGKPVKVTISQAIGHLKLADDGRDMCEMLIGALEEAKSKGTQQMVLLGE